MQHTEITGVKRQSYHNNSCIIVSNGKLYLKDLNKLLKFDKPRRAVKIIACDGASDFLKKAGYIPDVILGDFDSISPDTFNYFKRRKVQLKKIADQNSNDLEKAIKYSIQNNYSVIHLAGISGRRLDHTLNNISVLLKYHKKVKFIVHDNGFEGHIITKEYSALCRPGAIVSLIPLLEAAGVTSTGLKYPLKNLKLALGRREGALNETTGNSFSVKLHKGSLLVLIK